MKIRVRGHMVCSNCGRVVLNGEEVVTVHDMICCLSCSIDMLIERVDMLERRIEELEALTTITN